ncbi:hypothetical protein PG994_002378 [Apiospora phragmitis]|uniref:Uncharacterized protein n=1 Tax=Apiospora phragmitis TaxID=2905665 RepID=A0ABR1WW59_9PEZI
MDDLDISILNQVRRLPGSPTPSYKIYYKNPIGLATPAQQAGAYSAALRKRFWLPTSSNLTPLDIFPVQQIFIRHRLGLNRTANTKYDTLYLADGLLKPERSAAGFLVWLSMLEWRKGDFYFSHNTHASFSFSSAPASLTADPVSSAPVNPIMSENLSLPWWFSRGPGRSSCSRERVIWIRAGGRSSYPRGTIHQQNPANDTLIITPSCVHVTSPSRWRIRRRRL